MKETASNSSTFIVNTSVVRQVGIEIEGDALELTGPGHYSLDDFQSTFNKINQVHFPTALQSTVTTFIKNQYAGYQDILQNREAIGLLLQDKVATDTEVTEVMLKSQFQAQLIEIQKESH